MDIRKIKKLIELLEESGIAEIEIKEGEEAVRISRMPTGTSALHGMPTYAMPWPLRLPLPSRPHRLRWLRKPPPPGRAPMSTS